MVYIINIMLVHYKNLLVSMDFVMIKKILWILLCLLYKLWSLWPCRICRLPVLDSRILLSPKISWLSLWTKVLLILMLSLPRPMIKLKHFRNSRSLSSSSWFPVSRRKALNHGRIGFNCWSKGFLSRLALFSCLSSTSPWYQAPQTKRRKSSRLKSIWKGNKIKFYNLLSDFNIKF